MTYFATLEIVISRCRYNKTVLQDGTICSSSYLPKIQGSNLKLQMHVTIQNEKWRTHFCWGFFSLFCQTVHPHPI